MGLALEQAQKAYEKDEFPVGCVIVQGDKVIASGARQGTSRERTVYSEIDHAEIRAIKQLETIEFKFDPGQLVLFSTMEPCLMCLGAIILAGIKKIVYAYEDPMGGGTRCDLKQLPPLYERCNIDIVPGVLREKSLDFFYQFFNKENNLYWKNSFLEAYTLEQIQGKGLK